MTRRLFAVVATLLPTGLAGGAASPPPLQGVPLTGPTGLQLVVAAEPPFVFNIDTGRIERVTGLDVRSHPVVGVMPAGKDAVVWLDRARRGRKFPAAEIYVIRHGEAKARRVATGWDVAPDQAGRAIWVKSYSDARHCVLRELRLDGRRLVGPRAVSCLARLVDFGAGALLIRGTAVADPATGRILLPMSGIWAMGDGFALTSLSQGGLMLHDLRTGDRRELAWPSEIGGRDEAAVEPHSSLVARVALSFSNPSRDPQVTDVWLLDPLRLAFEHLPDMPAAVALKFTSMKWTSDGRLVILAESDGTDVVGVWRRGDERIATRVVRLPRRDSGSDSFVVW